jgi:hypothetical protein
MKKFLEWGAWAVGAVGVIFMLLGVIARLAGGIILNHMWDNYFDTGVGFIILGIFLLLGLIVAGGCEKK